MSNPLIRIHDMATGKIIDREMTNAEHAEYKTIQTADEAQAEAQAERQVARTALLARLGITESEAKLLLG